MQKEAYREATAVKVCCNHFYPPPSFFLLSSSSLFPPRDSPVLWRWWRESWKKNCLTLRTFKPTSSGHLLAPPPPHPILSRFLFVILMFYFRNNRFGLEYPRHKDTFLCGDSPTTATDISPNLNTVRSDESSDENRLPK